MAIYVFKRDSGRLFSWCPNDTDPVATPEQMEEHEEGPFDMVKGLPPLDATHEWDEKTRTVIVVT